MAAVAGAWSPPPAPKQLKRSRARTTDTLPDYFGSIVQVILGRDKPLARRNDKAANGFNRIGNAVRG
ncbi:hypothetical protein DPSP01_006879 [Paraphaeosphaeria sporulosa]